MNRKFLILGLIVQVIIGCNRNPEEITRFINPNLKVDTINVCAENDTTISTNQGIIIEIPENCFQYENGKEVSGNINILIQEVKTSFDLLKGRLTTISGDRIIQSSGMFNIIAVKDSQYLQLNKGKQIRISVPRQDSLKDWKLFKGKVNTQNNSYNWNLLTNNISDTYMDIIIKPINSSTKRDFFESKVIVGLIDPNNRDTTIIKEYWSHTSLFQSEIERNSEIKEIFPYVDSSLNDLSNNSYHSFSITSLDWINIDRFLDDLEAEDIKLTAKIEGNERFDKAYVNLVFLKRKIFLTSNEDEDRNFYFSKEKKSIVRLPKGEDVLVFIECYKNNQCYYDLIKIKLGSSNEITFKPGKIESSELNKIIEKELL